MIISYHTALENFPKTLAYFFHYKKTLAYFFSITCFNFLNIKFLGFYFLPFLFIDSKKLKHAFNF